MKLIWRDLGSAVHKRTHYVVDEETGQELLKLERRTNYWVYSSLGGMPRTSGTISGGVELDDARRDALAQAITELRRHHTELLTLGMAASALQASCAAPRSTAKPAALQVTSDYPHCASILVRKTPGAAAYDIDYQARAALRLVPGRTYKVALNLRLRLPAGFYAMIHGRSGNESSDLFEVVPAIIDNDYHNELHVMVRVKKPCTIRRSVRIAQLTLLPMHTPDVVVVPASQIPVTKRGGFGSTGGTVVAAPPPERPPLVKKVCAKKSRSRDKSGAR